MFKEGIILAPGCKANELLRELAKRGVNTLGLRIFSSIELAQTMLMVSGKAINKQIISSDCEAFIIASIIMDDNYRGIYKTNFFDDCVSLSNSLKMIRKLIVSDEIETMEKAFSLNTSFIDKNKELVAIYKEYKNKLNGKQIQGRIDQIDYLRYALNEFNGRIDANFYLLEEFMVSPLDEALLNKASNGNYKKISLSALFGIDKKQIKIDAFSSGYGITNEVKAIIDDIYKNNIPLDKCVIACTNSRYYQMFLDYSLEYNIPCTFGSGVLISNSYPYGLLNKLIDWGNNKYNIDSLYSVINSKYFDKELLKEELGISDEALEEVIDIAGGLRINNKEDASLYIENYRKKLIERISFYERLDNKDGNDIENINNFNKILSLIPYVINLNSLLKADYASLIEKYGVVRENEMMNIDYAGKAKIISTFRNYSLITNRDITEVIKYVMSSSVGSTLSSPKAIHITNIKGALSTVRENVYVCGLSSKYYPGGIKEDSNIHDMDMKFFGSGDNIPLSINKLNEKQKTLKDLLSIASSLNCNIKLSYPSFDANELKKINPSAELLDYYKANNNDATYEEFMNAIIKKDFYNVNIEYLSKKDKKIDREEVECTEKIDLFKRKYYPTRLKTFYECPKRFYLENIMGFSVDDEDDNDTIIPANDFGTLIHEEARLFMKRKWDLDTLISDARSAFDLYVSGRRVGTDNIIKTEKERFLNQLKVIYDYLKDYECVDAEVSVNGYHKGSYEEERINKKGEPIKVNKDYVIRLGGRVDLICKNKETGEMLVIDYKTGRSQKHDENDPISCMQGVIYASLFNSNNKGNDNSNDNEEVNKCAFLYPALKKMIVCVNNSETREIINNEVLDKLAIAINNNSFIIKPDEKGICKYCKFGRMCGKSFKKTEDDEE